MNREHAYAYEAGYRDGSINYELEHCPACKNVADLQEALAENANLRERITTQKQTIQAYRDESREWREVAECAQAENAKLRELVRDFDKCLTEAVRLAYIQGHATIYDSTLLDSLHPRMRELGIEAE